MSHHRSLSRRSLCLSALPLSAASSSLPCANSPGTPFENNRALAAQILSDKRLDQVHQMALALLANGLRAGSGYPEVWIRDTNTFIEAALDDRVLKARDFYGWWSRDNQGRGSGAFRGGAGVLAKTVTVLRTWAKQNA